MDRTSPSRAEGPASRRHHLCGLLLQTRSSGAVGLRGLLLLGLQSNNWVANVQALPCFSSFEKTKTVMSMRRFY